MDQVSSMKKWFSRVVLVGVCVVLYYISALFTQNSVLIREVRVMQDVTIANRQPVKGAAQPRHDDQPMFVLTLGYQRTASSLISNMVGNLDNQFFLYEPLDMTFTALYGTAPGWSVPSEIFNTEQGMMRNDPDELAAMQWTLDSIFRCTISDKWPIQYLMHPFILSRGKKDYPNCVKQRLTANVELKQAGLKGLATCLTKIKSLCQGRFQAGSEKLKKCKRMMFTDQQFRISVNRTESYAGFTSQEVAMFDDYYKCLNAYNVITRECAREHLDKPCLKSSTRIVKTVRASMEVSRYFLERYSNFRLIHLFRDPRGTAKSRSDAKWSNGAYEHHAALNIAKLYCQNVLSDYTIRRDLEKKYSAQILQLISDEFMTDSIDYVDKIAELIAKNKTTMVRMVMRRLANSGIEQSPEDGDLLLDTIDVLPNNTTTNAKQAVNHTKQAYVDKRHRTGESRIQFWQEAFNFKLVRDIQDVCADFYRDIPYDWPFLIA